jgi:YrhK-like protein
MLTRTVIRHDDSVLTSPKRPTYSAVNHPLNSASGSHWKLERIQIMADLGSAVLFVVGCVGFYSERHQTGAITAFLVGSLLFLVSALGAAAAQHDSTRLANRHRSSHPPTNTPGESS